jgi:predicted dehydrogenase
MAVIGCGGIACQFHLKILRACRDAEVVGVADLRPEARERAAALVGAPATEDWRELVSRPEVDAVVVCTENSAHAEIATAVLEAQHHLYLEKPIALSVPDADAVVGAGEGAGVVTSIGFSHRFMPVYHQARQWLRSGEVGRVTHVRTRYCEPVPIERMPAWKRERATGGGALLDLGSHHIDLARWLLGEDMGEVESAELRSEASEHDSATFRSCSENGVPVDAEFSYRRGRICDWEIEGERGVVAIDRIGGTARIRSSGARPGRRDRLRARLRGLPIPRRERSFDLALNAFVDRVVSGTGELPSLADGRRSLEFALAVEAAAGEA